MSRDYPDWVHPLKAAQARRVFSGSMKLSQLSRVLDLIEPPGEDEIGFEIAFELDDQAQARAQVRIRGTVAMLCQRSLKPYRQAVDSQSVIGIVSDELAAEGLPDDYEPLVLPEQRLSLADLVAEELLLALPLVPRSPDSEPLIAEVPEPEPDTQRPFAGLAQLKKQRRTD